nr:uncharacterized protein LOC113706115 [Coffea arabica]
MPWLKRGACVGDVANRYWLESVRPSRLCSSREFTLDSIVPPKKKKYYLVSNVKYFASKEYVRCLPASQLTFCASDRKLKVQVQLSECFIKTETNTPCKYSQNLFTNPADVAEIALTIFCSEVRNAVRGRKLDCGQWIESPREGEKESTFQIEENHKEILKGGEKDLAFQLLPSQHELLCI